MDRLVQFLERLARERFYGAVLVRCEAGRVTHVEVSAARTYEYARLPLDARERIV